MPELISFDFVRDRRPGTDDAHVAFENIEKLREFVDAGSP
jgi:hypothetical protein